MRTILTRVSINIAYSDKQEEKKIFSEIIKLVPSFHELIKACSGHRRAFLNLLKMVSPHLLSRITFILLFY